MLNRMILGVVAFTISNAAVATKDEAASASIAITQAHLNKVVCQLNERPRKALLGIETPAERFNASVASTG